MVTQKPAKKELPDARAPVRRAETLRDRVAGRVPWAAAVSRRPPEPVLIARLAKLDDFFAEI